MPLTKITGGEFDNTQGGLSVAGIITATSFSGNGASLTTLNASNISSGTLPDARFPATLPALGAASATSIVVSSGSTFTNGPVFIGAATSTGTASQPLQVTGGAYVSGNLGIGINNPTEKTTINGNILLDYAISYSTYSEIRARYIGQNNCQSAIRFYNPNNAYDGAFTIWTQPNTLNASMVERMRIDGVGAIIKNQATREYNYSGFVANNQVITIDVPVVDDTNAGGGHKIWANHTHYNWSSYGAMIECWVSSRGATILEQLNTHNITSGNGGAWTVTKPNTTTLRISKSAGTYPGGGYYWVCVVTNY